MLFYTRLIAAEAAPGSHLQDTIQLTFQDADGDKQFMRLRYIQSHLDYFADHVGNTYVLSRKDKRFPGRDEIHPTYSFHKWPIDDVTRDDLVKLSAEELRDLADRITLEGKRNINRLFGKTASVDAMHTQMMGRATRPAPTDPVIKDHAATTAPAAATVRELINSGSAAPSDRLAWHNFKWRNATVDSTNPDSVVISKTSNTKPDSAERLRSLIHQAEAYNAIVISGKIEQSLIDSWKVRFAELEGDHSKESDSVHYTLKGAEVVGNQIAETMRIILKDDTPSCSMWDRLVRFFGRS